MGHARNHPALGGTESHPLACWGLLLVEAPGAQPSRLASKTWPGPQGWRVSSDHWGDRTGPSQGGACGFMDLVVAVGVKVALRMWGAGSWDSLADWMGVRRGLNFLVVALWKKTNKMQNCGRERGRVGGETRFQGAQALT